EVDMPSLRSNRIRRLRGLAAGIGVVAAGIVAASVAASRDWIAPPTRDFPLSGGNYWDQRYSALDKINTSNVKKLGAAWRIRREDGRRGVQTEGLPVVTDGVMYVTTGPRTALAIDAARGKVKWRYRPDTEGPNGEKKGVAVAEGKVFFARRDAVLVA